VVISLATTVRAAVAVHNSMMTLFAAYELAWAVRADADSFDVVGDDMARSYTFHPSGTHATGVFGYILQRHSFQPSYNQQTVQAHYFLGYHFAEESIALGSSRPKSSLRRSAVTRSVAARLSIGSEAQG
jgi:hypothetical protein